MGHPLSRSLPPAADRQRLSPCSPAASRYPRQCHGPRGRGAAGLEALLRDLSWPSSLQNSTASFKETERTLLFAMVLNYATAWKSRRINGREASGSSRSFLPKTAPHTSAGAPHFSCTGDISAKFHACGPRIDEAHLTTVEASGHRGPSHGLCSFCKATRRSAKRSWQAKKPPEAAWRPSRRLLGQAVKKLSRSKPTSLTVHRLSTPGTSSPSTRGASRINSPSSRFSLRSACQRCLL